MTLPLLNQGDLPPEVADLYRHAMTVMREADVPFLVGGAYAYGCYTDIERHTKDFDVFLRKADIERALAAFDAAGYRTELTFPHWLGKAYRGDDFIDLIFQSGNGIAGVSDSWFARATEKPVLGMPVLLCPPEEIIWSKAFIMERERFDGSDVAHLIRSCGLGLDWDHLVTLFADHWRVLLSHLVLFGFIYPSERGNIPDGVMQDLLSRLQAEGQSPPPAEKVCRGTLLSRAQYLVDVARFGYLDGRLEDPNVHMTEADIAHWTAAIEDEHRPR